MEPEQQFVESVEFASPETFVFDAYESTVTPVIEAPKEIEPEPEPEPKPELASPKKVSKPTKFGYSRMKERKGL